MMPLTTCTDIDVLCADPVGMVTAMGTAKPFGPFHFEKVIVTGLFTGKAVLKLDLTGVVSQQFDVLQATAADQVIVGDIENMIRLMIRQMPLE